METIFQGKKNITYKDLLIPKLDKLKKKLLMKGIESNIKKKK
jgi:hypothetical protein